LGDRGAIQATLFFVEAEDIIDFSFGENRYVQRDGTSTRRGIELGGSYDIADGWIVDGAYTYTDSFSDVTLDSSGWTLAVPRHTLSATVSGEIAPRWTLALAGEFQADRPELDDFAVFDSTVAYEITDGIDAYLRVENLLDTQYQTVPGYGTSDRAFYVGLRASF
jgi:vitamin B12 transporter